MWFDALGRHSWGQIRTGTTTVLAVSPASFAITANAVAFQIKEAVAPAAFTITGGVVVDSIGEQVSPAAFTITTYPVGLSRTGFDYDFQQGGVGHYKLDIERGRQLAKMERKVPPPIDLRTAPTFKPVGSPPIAPALPAPQVAAAPNQRAGDAAAQAAVRRKRDIEAILLLAC